jgi:hypothetical protein
MNIMQIVMGAVCIVGIFGCLCEMLLGVEALQEE